MTIQLFCGECVRLQVARSQENPGARLEHLNPSFDLELSDSGVYEGKCPAGHEYRIVLQHGKYEVLFDLAAQALRDGYYREAVATFMSSLERFFEFFVEAVYFHFNPNNATDEAERAERWHAQRSAFGKTWKWAERQSERQFGMFLLAHLLLTGQEPPVSKNKYEEHFIRVRNAVIHSGEIIDRKRACDFGRSVYDLINGLSDVLHEKCEEGAQRAIALRVDEGQKQLQRGGDEQAAVFSLPMPVDYTNRNPRLPFDEVLEKQGPWDFWKGHVRLSDIAARAQVEVNTVVQLILKEYGGAVIWPGGLPAPLGATKTPRE